MASIERTAYPRLNNNSSSLELEKLFTPNPDEIAFAKSKSNNETGYLSLMVYLKCFENLFYFPQKKDIPKSIINHIRKRLKLPKKTPFLVPKRSQARYRGYIRYYLGIKNPDQERIEIIEKSMEKTALIRNDPVDLINISIQELLSSRHELPAYSNLNRLALKIRNKTHKSIYRKINKKLRKENRDFLKSLLKTSKEYNRSKYNRLKELPKSISLNHLDQWLDHLEWIKSLGIADKYLKGISINKIELFAEEARSLDASEIKGFQKPKQYTLILSLIRSTLHTTTDSLVDMFLKRIKIIHNSASEKLKEVREENIGLNEKLIDLLESILLSFEENNGSKIEEVIKEYGETDKLIEECRKVNAYKDNNYLPFLWKYYWRHRSSLFRVIKALDFSSTTEDQSVANAIDYLKRCQYKKASNIDAEVDLDFASKRWKKLVITKDKEKFDRRYFELCVFSYLADELRSGDICVADSNDYNDFRTQLLSWKECLALLDSYCKNIGIANTAEDFVKQLIEELRKTAETVDNNYPNNSHLIITEDGQVKLKKYKKKTLSPEAIEIADLIEKRMPERKLLDILCNCETWINWTKHFAPISGSDPKLSEPEKSYIVTTFTYGTSFSPNQFSKHMEDVSPHSISYINGRHVNVDKLNKVNADFVNAYNRFSLSKLWGNGSTAGADGTHVKIYENNLLAEYHIRYGAIGGISYSHVADNYVALFNNFIPCGVWEGIYIIEGLLKNESDIHPDTIHADTQGQSTPVFALSHLLGINLMPRIRNWKDLTIYRANASDSYEHIDGLFGDHINWELIKTHWKDMIQVVISIQEGKISSSRLLKILGTYSKKNKLYKAFQELGRVRRSIFLLKYISDPEMQQMITAMANKVESYHNFSEYFRFGSMGMLRTNDPVEQEKMMKYNNIIANAVMLQNVVDITNIINEMIDEGVKIEPEHLLGLSPYLTSSILRFGNYTLNMAIVPPPLIETINFISMN
jgi:TnpA family transposase